jgi:hypothetical protein
MSKARLSEVRSAADRTRRAPDRPHFGFAMTATAIEQDQRYLAALRRSVACPSS